MGGKADPADAAQVGAGKKMYSVRCAACHGAKLEGQPNRQQRLTNGRMPATPHDESGHTWHHADEVLFGITKHGLLPGECAPPRYESNLPAFGGKLSDEEIRTVLAFIKSHWKSKDLLDARAEILRNAARR